MLQCCDQALQECCDQCRVAIKFVVNVELQHVIETMIYTEVIIVGQFFQNTNWIMTSVVLTWVVITIGYIIVRATQSLNFTDTKGGLIVYGIVILTVEVCSLYPVTPTHSTAYVSYQYCMGEVLMSVFCQVNVYINMHIRCIYPIQ